MGSEKDCRKGRAEKRKTRQRASRLEGLTSPSGEARLGLDAALSPLEVFG
jgi:hypothetical protein